MSDVIDLSYMARNRVFIAQIALRACNDARQVQNMSNYELGVHHYAYGVPAILGVTYSEI